MSKRIKIFGHLLVEVIRKDLCVGCGTCVSVCPVDAIAMQDGVPKLVGQCIACGMCYNNCPRSEFDVQGIEARIFDRSRTEEEAEIGVYRACYAVRAKGDEIRGRCQDGGAVTAILSQFLADGGECAVGGGPRRRKGLGPQARGRPVRGGGRGGGGDEVHP